MAKIDYPIPERMKHLKIDDRGYPIPAFAAIINGVPDFRYQDAGKQMRALKGHLCAICGQKLAKDFAYVISGPIGFINCVSSDAAMHKECADYSIHVCPHLVREKADRRDTNIPEKTHDMEGQILSKPNGFVLVKIKTNYNIIKGTKGEWLIKYTPESAEKYLYVNGLLQKA